MCAQVCRAVVVIAVSLRIYDVLSKYMLAWPGSNFRRHHVLHMIPGHNTGLPRLGGACCPSTAAAAIVSEGYLYRVPEQQRWWLHVQIQR